MSVYGTELVLFTLLFALVTGLGFYAARWNSSGTLDHLEGWRLGGRLLRAEGEVHQRTRSGAHPRRHGSGRLAPGHQPHQDPERVLEDRWLLQARRVDIEVGIAQKTSRGAGPLP
jgi:hypothetical protein